MSKAFTGEEQNRAAEDPVIYAMDKEQLKKSIEHTRSLMQKAAKDLDFMLAAQYRDEMLKLQDILESKL